MNVNESIDIIGLWTKTKDRLVFNVWNSYPGLVAWKGDVKGMPVYKATLTNVKTTLIADALKKCLDGNKLVKEQLGFSNYNKASGTSESAGLLTIGNDPDRGIYFEVSSPDNKHTITFPCILDQDTWTHNGNKVTVIEQTRVGARAILSALDKVQTQIVASHMSFLPTRSNYEKKDGGGSSMTPAKQDPSKGTGDFNGAW